MLGGFIAGGAFGVSLMVDWRPGVLPVVRMVAMGESSIAESDRHWELSREYLENAGEYLRRGNNKRASEKTWGAVAQFLIAIAGRRGWNHNGHRLLIDIARQVSDEGGRPDWFIAFLAAKDLHANFYDDLMESGDIEIVINGARVFLQELEGIRLAEPPVFMAGSREQRRRWQRLTGDALPPG